MKALQMVMNVTIVVMVLSLYPLVKKGLVKAAWEMILINFFSFINTSIKIIIY